MDALLNAILSFLKTATVLILAVGALIAALVVVMRNAVDVQEIWNKFRHKVPDERFPSPETSEVAENPRLPLSDVPSTSAQDIAMPIRRSSPRVDPGPHSGTTSPLSGPEYVPDAKCEFPEPHPNTDDYSNPSRWLRLRLKQARWAFSMEEVETNRGWSLVAAASNESHDVLVLATRWSQPRGIEIRGRWEPGEIYYFGVWTAKDWHRVLARAAATLAVHPGEFMTLAVVERPELISTLHIASWTMRRH